MTNKLIIIVAVLTGLALFSFKSGNPKAKTLIYVRVFEYLMVKGEIHVVKENGSFETIELEKYKGDGILENSQTIAKTLNRLVDEGYSLISGSSSIKEGEKHAEFVLTKED